LKSGTPEQALAGLRAGEVVIGTVLAQRTGLEMGDTMTLQTDKGEKQFKVAATSNEYMVGGLAMYMNRETARERLGAEGTDVFIVKVKPERFAAVETTLAAMCDEHGLLLQSQQALREFVDSMMAGVVGGLWVLLSLCLVVAGFGVANTLAMNVLEQTRELGLLRVVAMTKKQVRRTIVSQAVIMALIGLIPGVAVGCGLAYLMNLTTNPEFGHQVAFVVQPALMAGCFVAGFVIVLLTAWLPAERAARLELTMALHYE
jgi:putative ABC transport system permease protein